MFKNNVKSKEDYNHRYFPEIGIGKYSPKFTTKEKSLNVFNNARDKALKTFFDEIGPTEKVSYQNDFVNPWIETNIDQAEKLGKKKRKTAMELLEENRQQIKAYQNLMQDIIDLQDLHKKWSYKQMHPKFGEEFRFRPSLRKEMEVEPTPEMMEARKHRLI